MKTPNHLKQLEELLMQLFKRTAEAKTLGYTGRYNDFCSTEAYATGCSAYQLQRRAWSVFKSASVQVEEIEVLLDVIETAICSRADAQVLMDLVLDAFRILKEETQ